MHLIFQREFESFMKSTEVINGSLQKYVSLIITFVCFYVCYIFIIMMFSICKMNNVVLSVLSKNCGCFVHVFMYTVLVLLQSD